MDPTTAPSCDYRAARFRATAIRSCGARLIRVIGVGLCPSAGWRLEFVPANGGIVPHPDRLWLAVRETPPDDSALRAEVPTEVEAIIEDCEATEIVIVFAGRDPVTVPVLDAAGVQAPATPVPHTKVPRTHAPRELARR